MHAVTFEMAPGEMVALVGPSGGGKSTIADLIPRFYDPDAGSVTIDGVDLRDIAVKDIRRSLGVVTQETVLFNDTVANNIAYGVSDIPFENIEKAAEAANALEFIEELPDGFETVIGERGCWLSGGQKQRVNLARSLAALPDVMLCDEVTSALDSIVAANVVKLLKRLRDLTGVSFVFITHDLSTVAAFADEIVVLYAGRIVEQGPVDEVLSPPFHPYTRLLISSVPEMRVGWLEDTMEKREMAVGIARGVEITETGCPFYNRCPQAITGTCERVVAPTYELASGHFISCHHNEEYLSQAEEAPQQVLHGFETVDPEGDHAAKAH